MKCAAKTKNGLCSRNHHSGCTIDSKAEKWVYYLCAQHFAMINEGKDVTLDKSTRSGHKLVHTTTEPGQIAQAYLNKEPVMNIQDIADALANDPEYQAQVIKDGEPPETFPQEDYGQDDDKDDCSDELPFIVAGTGSRSLKTADPAFKALVVAWTRARLLRLKEKYGDRLVIMSGMAEGWDELLAVTAMKLGIRLWCYVPNKGYGRYYWAQHSLTGHNRMAKFEEIVGVMHYDEDNNVFYFTDGYAEKVELTMEDRLHLSGLYAPVPNMPGKTEHANFARNRAMVEDADAFLVWDPSSSGTAHAFGLIKKSGKPFEICNTKVS